MSEQLMNEAEVERVTGFKAASKQCEVLSNHGIFFVKDRNGTPHVSWHNFNNPVHLRFNQALAHNEEPNFAAMD